LGWSVVIAASKIAVEANRVGAFRAACGFLAREAAFLQVAGMVVNESTAACIPEANGRLLE